MPSRMAAPSSGRPNVRQRGGEHDERRARHAGDALARQHQRQHHDHLLAEGQLDAGELRDEHARERQIQRRAVEVEAVAGRQHEADDVLRHAEALHHLERLRQRRFAAGGRERDQERLADGAQEREERHADQVRHAADDDQRRRSTRPTYISSDELAEREQDAEPLAADGRGNRRHHADRREHHHVAGELEHHLRGALEHVEDRLPFSPIAASATPKKIAKTTTCRMSPRAIASTTDVGNRCRKMSQPVCWLLRHRRAAPSCRRRPAACTPGARLEDVDEHQARGTARSSSRPRSR